MYSWISFFFSKIWGAATAPILYHASRDGYVMNAYFTISEVVDVYGMFLITFIFVGMFVYYRNTILSVYVLPFGLTFKSLKWESYRPFYSLANSLTNKARSFSLFTKLFRSLNSVISNFASYVKVLIRK